jgi:glucan biosynthesis protein C
LELVDEHGNKNSPRRTDLDWLRIIAVILLVPFHAALIFDSNPESIVYVKDIWTNAVLIQIAYFMNRWHMPLLYFIAGASTWFALDKRSIKDYMIERIKRLLIPLIFGVVCLIPLMIYLYLSVQHGTELSFWEFYIYFFSHASDLGGMDGQFSPAHLWFILYLFVFSIILCYPFLILKRGRGEKFIQRLVKLFEIPGILLMIPALIITIAAALPGISGKNPFFYAMFFIFGYIFMANPRFQEKIDQYIVPAFILGIFFVIIDYIWFTTELTAWSFQWIFQGILYNSSRWFFVIAALGFGHKVINKKNSILDYLNSAAYPFYILHMVMLTIVGILIIQLPIGIWEKYGIIVILTICSTFVVYDIGVKRTNLTRILFGMKPLIKSEKKDN